MMKPSSQNWTLVTRNAAFTSFNRKPNKWVTHLCRRMLNLPSSLRGVAARSIKSREATIFRADGVVLGLGTTPSRLMKRRRATPPNLGGEFLFGCFALVHPEFPQIRSSDLADSRRNGFVQDPHHALTPPHLAAGHFGNALQKRRRQHD